MTARRAAAAVLVTAGWLSAATAAEPADLARKAHEILKTNCGRCHGPGGSEEGEVLEASELPHVAAQRVITQDAGLQAASEQVGRVGSRQAVWKALLGICWFGRMRPAPGIRSSPAWAGKAALR